MMPNGARCFFPSRPFEASRELAARAGCDLAVSNGNASGIGNVLAVTPLVEALALREGRRLNLLTAPLNPAVGTVQGEAKYPIWENNPFVNSIVDASTFGMDAVETIAREQDNCCQFNHVIENICFHYNVRPRHLRPSLYLTLEEQRWALDMLSVLPRPVVAFHPTGKTATKRQEPWGEERWRSVLDRAKSLASFVQIGMPGADNPKLGAFQPTTTLRQYFALIWASDAFVGFDSSPMHVATAFQKPTLALWDAQQKLVAEELWQTGFAPAVILRWGYPQNRNLMILGERDSELVDLVVTWLTDTLGPTSRFYFKANM